MIFKRQNIETNLIDFVGSEQFNNLKLILEDAALAKFKEMQGTKLPYDEMLANKAILNFYMSYAETLERKVKAIESRKVAEMQEKISQAQEDLG